ncbi:hypothetical protein PMIN01_06267 [Paraphaeosphaeria minitans]|uniref:Uncharacterized protein n=1 Tax=Paraphaeosphaeria minitans TaxID=565426 RepID=A0A9P6GJK1_9PLEO|nr:hypothetical protein PMIN01_06267 [Paraphaeosphaeria minitans]
MRSLLALGGATGVGYAMWIRVVVWRSSPRQREVAERSFDLQEEMWVCERRQTRCPFAKKRDEPWKLTSQVPMRARATKHCQATSSVLRAASCSPIARLPHAHSHSHSLAVAFPHRTILHYLAFRVFPPTLGEHLGRDAAACACYWLHFPQTLRGASGVPGCVVALVHTQRIRPRYVAKLSSTRTTRWHTAPLLIVTMLSEGIPAMWAVAAAQPEEAHQQQKLISNIKSSTVETHQQ